MLAKLRNRPAKLGPYKASLLLGNYDHVLAHLPPKYFMKLKRSSIAKHYACVPTHIYLTHEN